MQKTFLINSDFYMSNNSVINYPLSFQEALEKVMNGEGWAQAQDFKDGIIMMDRGTQSIEGMNHLHIHDFNANINERKTPILITRNLIRQRFRIVTTQAEAMRK